MNRASWGVFKPSIFLYCLKGIVMLTVNAKLIGEEAAGIMTHEVD